MENINYKEFLEKISTYDKFYNWSIIEDKYSIIFKMDNVVVFKIHTNQNCELLNLSMTSTKEDMMIVKFLSNPNEWFDNLVHD